MPDIVKGKRRRQYSRAAIWKSLEERRNGYGSIIGFHRTTSPAVALTLDFDPARQLPLDVRLDVQPLSFFAETERCRKFMDVVRAWASHTRSLTAWLTSQPRSKPRCVENAPA